VNNNNKDFIITIINHSHRAQTINCLNSIMRNIPSSNYDIVVLDNASTDDSSQIIPEQFPEIHFIKQQERKGFAANQNRMLKEYSGKARYYVLLNDDTIVLKNSIEKIYKFMEDNPDVGICGARLLFPDGSFQISAGIFPSMFKEVIRYMNLKSWVLTSEIKGFIGKHLRFMLPFEIREYLRSFVKEKGIREVDYVSGACMMVREEVFEEIGFLDESYVMYSEDVDFCYRAKLKGWRIFLHNDANIIHIMSMSKSPFTVRNFEMSKIKFFAKYYKALPLLFYKMAICIISLFKGILSSMEGLSEIGRVDFSLTREIWKVDK